MKKIVIFCLLGITVLLCTACEFTPSPDTVTVSGNTKTIIREADSVESRYNIIFEGLDFKHNNNASINIVAVRSSEKEKARVEVTYSEQFDNYFFGISILDETILVRVDSEYQYDIDTFDMTIYAHFDKVEMNGGGYKASINTWGISDLNIDVSGTVDCKVSRILYYSPLRINTSGRSKLHLSGSSKTANITASGHSEIDAKYLSCGSVNIESSGSSDIEISVRDRLNGKAHGFSNIGYYGSPKLTIDASGSSNVEQISSISR